MKPIPFGRKDISKDDVLAAQEVLNSDIYLDSRVKWNFPQAEKYYASVITLPLYYGLTVK